MASLYTMSCGDAKQQAEDDNTCFVLDTLMDAITAVTTKGAISDDEWEGNIYIYIWVYIYQYI